VGKKKQVCKYLHPTVKKSQGSFDVTGSHAQPSPAYSERWRWCPIEQYTQEVKLYHFITQAETKRETYCSNLT